MSSAVGSDTTEFHCGPKINSVQSSLHIETPRRRPDLLTPYNDRNPLCDPSRRFVRIFFPIRISIRPVYPVAYMPYRSLSSCMDPIDSADTYVCMYIDIYI